MSNMILPMTKPTPRSRAKHKSSRHLYLSSNILQIVITALLIASRSKVVMAQPQCTSFTIDPLALNPSTMVPYLTELSQLGGSQLLVFPMQELVIDLPTISDLIGSPAGCSIPTTAYIAGVDLCGTALIPDTRYGLQITFPTVMFKPGNVDTVCTIDFQWADAGMRYNFFQVAAGSFYQRACSQYVPIVDPAATINFKFTTGYVGADQRWENFAQFVHWQRTNPVNFKLEKFDFASGICGGLTVSVQNCSGTLNSAHFTIFNGKIQLLVSGMTVAAGTYTCRLVFTPNLTIAINAPPQQFIPITLESVDSCPRPLPIAPQNLILPATYDVDPNPDPVEYWQLDFSYDCHMPPFQLTADFIGCTTTITHTTNDHEGATLINSSDQYISMGYPNPISLIQDNFASYTKQVAFSISQNVSIFEANLFAIFN